MTDIESEESRTERHRKEINYDEMYLTLLRGSLALAEVGIYDVSEDLAASAIKMRFKLRHGEDPTYAE